MTARKQRGEALLEPTQNGYHVIWPTVVTGLALLALGLILRVAPIDAPVVQALNTTHVGAWGQAADVIYLALEPLPSALLTLLILLAIAVTSRSLRTAAVFGGIVALTWLPTAAIKLIVNRPRPDALALSNPFSPAQLDGSFPSGHTAFIVALAIAFWYLLHKTRWAALVVIGGITATTTLGLAVMSDGLHYPTDVEASILWALAMAPTARWLMADVILKGRFHATRHAGVPPQDA